MQTHRSRESVALEMLQKPELFPSLPKRSEYDRLICLWRIPSFEPHSSWSLYRERKTNEHFVRRLEHDPHRGLPANISAPHVFGSEAPISAELATKIVEQFEGLTVPMFRRPAWAGMDGVSFGVHIGNFWQSTTVNWWSSFSPEWKPLNELFQEIVVQLDSLLPASTLREIEL